MDIVTLGAALKGAKNYTDTKTEAFEEGVNYKGSVDYYNDLPNDAEVGDSYTVKYQGTSGSNVSGLRYTWGYDAGAGENAWIPFSKDSYTKGEVDTLLNAKANQATTYTKIETDNLLMTHFVKGENIDITDNLDGTQTISATGISAVDSVAREEISDHEANKNNPHEVTATQLGIENKSAASGGTDDSLVTTGDKYNWNNKVYAKLNSEDTEMLELYIEEV